MCARLEALELREQLRCEGLSVLVDPEKDTSSVLTIKGPTTGSTTTNIAQEPSSGIVDTESTEALQKSPSFSGGHCPMVWSSFSGASWAEVSDTSVIFLPIPVNEVYNPVRSSQTWSNGCVCQLRPTPPTNEPLSGPPLPPRLGTEVSHNRDEVVHARSENTTGANAMGYSRHPRRFDLIQYRSSTFRPIIPSSKPLSSPSIPGRIGTVASHGPDHLLAPCEDCGGNELESGIIAHLGPRQSDYFQCNTCRRLSEYRTIIRVTAFSTGGGSLGDLVGVTNHLRVTFDWMRFQSRNRETTKRINLRYTLVRTSKGVSFLNYYDDEADQDLQPKRLKT